MKAISKLRLVFLTLGLLFALVSAAIGQDAAAKIKNQIDHLQQALESKPVSNSEWKDAKPDITDSLKQANQALRAGRLYLSLEELADAWSSFGATESETQKSQEELLKGGLPGVDSELQKMRLEVSAIEKRIGLQNWDTVPVAVRAMAERAQGRSGPLLEGGRGFAHLPDTEKRAVSDNYTSALFYAGKGRAQAEFNDFCHSLNLPLKTAPLPLPLPLHSVSNELRQLQDRVAAAYQPPRSVKHNSDFIHLNSTLKLASELDAAKMYAGALYQYLDAMQEFTALDVAAPTVAKRLRLRKSLHEIRTQLDSSRQDESLAQLYLERVEAGLMNSPSADDWVTAEIIVEQVLPAYFVATKAVPPSDHLAPAEITITLVRWPFT
jgi:hypothetical protein